MRIATNWKTIGLNLAGYAAIGVFLALINPFNSLEGKPLAIGIAYWVSLLVWGGLVGEGLVLLRNRLARPPPHWVSFVGASLLLTVCVFPALLGAERFLMGRTVPPEQWPRMMVFVWLISAGVSVLNLTRRPIALVSAEPGAPPGQAFRDRLPPPMRVATVYAVESEDHYLRVHTSSGSTLILMRLGDAIRELAGVEGQQTHRSWWVAKEGVADATREKGRLMLKLKSGAEVPVSRTYASAVRAAGWI